MKSLETTDAMSRAVQRTPHRVSLDDIKNNIAGEYFITGDKMVGIAPALPALNCLTVCLLVLRNGFTIIGKSAPADPDNFDPELGRTFAREDAMRQAWPLMGYALREKLMGEAA